MNTHAEKPIENKVQTARVSTIQLHDFGESSLQFNDEREVNQKQERIQLMASQRSDAMQLKGFQNQFSGNSNSNKLAQLQSLADGKVSSSPAIQKKENDTGLPNQIKSGIESLSGHSLDDVKVHYNSSKPAQLNAHAYAQGTDIHVAPQQEKHVAHEAWHVVQQKQGRVKATKQLKSQVNINDDPSLEKEADVMGAKASRLQIPSPKQLVTKTSSKIQNKAIQRQIMVADKELSVANATRILQTDWHLEPAGALDQVLTQFDFQNRKFKDVDHLRRQVEIELEQTADHVQAQHPTHTPSEDPKGDLGAAQIVDLYLAHSPLGAYVAQAKRNGKPNVKIVRLSAEAFVAQYHKNSRAGLEETPAFANDPTQLAMAYRFLERKPVTAVGFVSKDATTVYININHDQLDTSIHEAIHHYGVGFTAGLGRLINEGATEYLTEIACASSRVPLVTQAYTLETGLIKKLVTGGAISNSALIQAYFSGNSEPIEAAIHQVAYKYDMDANKLIAASRTNSKHDFMMANLGA